MLQRDFIMRQVHQLAQVLARIMSLDIGQTEGDPEALLSEAVAQVTGIDMERLRRMSADELEAVCSPNGSFSSDLAVALADVLMEDAAIQDTLGRRQESRMAMECAMTLYRMARDAGGTLPLSALGRL
jgi:hypothetical protein